MSRIMRAFIAVSIVILILTIGLTPRPHRPKHRSKIGLQLSMESSCTTSLLVRGDPVILLHGYAQNSYMWRPLMVDLAKTHTIIAPDLRGWTAYAYTKVEPEEADQLIEASTHDPHFLISGPQSF